MHTSVSRWAAARPGAAKARRGNQLGRVAAPRAPRKPRRVSLGMVSISAFCWLAPLEIGGAEEQGDQPRCLLVQVPERHPLTARPPLADVLDQQVAVRRLEPTLEQEGRHGV